MTNKLTKVMAALVVVGLVATGPMAYAENDGDSTDSGKGYKHGDGKEFFKELNLTTEQKEKLKAQREAKRESNKALREQMKTKMQALHEAIAKPGTKPSDVSGLVAEVNTLKGQMFSQMIDGVFAMKEILTPEQFAKMQAKHQERMDKKHKGWGKSDSPSED
jgi:Spy/CpxP family protein refolding chaperone